MGQCNGSDCAICQYLHIQVGVGKVKTTLYKVRWEGYGQKDDTWESIASTGIMVRSFKESHTKDLEKLTADLLCETGKEKQTMS
jgi:hypothetical protein